MIAPDDAQQLCVEAVALLAAADPLQVARILSEAARAQPCGGRLALARIVVQSLAGNDAGFLDQLTDDLRRAPPIPADAPSPMKSGPPAHWRGRPHRHRHNRPVTQG